MRTRGRELAIFDVAGRVYVLDNRCPHAGGPLAEGTVIDTTVTCSWHCATFDLETGRSLDAISRHDVDTFPVRVRDGRIWVRLPDEDEQT